ncbi:MAG: hypothetical protein OM95_14005 [Bdellovibrio sp. ArHS]|uniref:DEAD/DEAH box helicase n=1 Tax=Bdellovibrio sp. ArHS TaxID=1569284 RepID=UPI000583CBD3|nr:AAA domain-containing protein [Bdellovibrio sp. ArHS]KHD87552.1 MAG: hypothetical protein OM95_14005 [Bdellovibrio sp. ArHS]
MKPNAKIDMHSFIKMIRAEKRAEYSRYRGEVDAPLSQVCDSADALGPLILKQKLGFARWVLEGKACYSRFRPGDTVEIRLQKAGSDLSVKFSDGWRVETVRYSEPGKIEVTVGGIKPLEEEDIREVFLFKSSSSVFNNLLMKKIYEMGSSTAPILLNSGGRYPLSVEGANFRRIYDGLNDIQKNAVHQLIGDDMNGAVQGPPGTGKTQLLQAIIALALNSKMKVCVTSFTNAAVDNLLARVVRENPDYDWVRVGNSDKIRGEFYTQNEGSAAVSSPDFKKSLDEYQLLGATLHKLAFNRSAPKVDLLVVDEAGQVPVYFWPFIQRLTRRLILVGDQFQLPPVLSAKHADIQYDNIFSLFVGEDTPMLETQYRMRREIQAWSSEKFYKGRLVPHVSVVNRDYFAQSPAFLTDDFVVPKRFSSGSSGKFSQKEADFITDKVERIMKSRDNAETVGVICPYRIQAGIVNAALQNRLGTTAASKVLVDTVERFQGQEREAIFLSFGGDGGSSEDLHFLSDIRRLNVAVTRAKSRFFCLYDEKLVENAVASQSEELAEFLSWLKDRRTYIRRAA